MSSVIPERLWQIKRLGYLYQQRRRICEGNKHTVHPERYSLRPSISFWSSKLNHLPLCFFVPPSDLEFISVLLVHRNGVHSKCQNEISSCMGIMKPAQARERQHLLLRLGDDKISTPAQAQQQQQYEILYKDDTTTF